MNSFRADPQRMSRAGGWLFIARTLALFFGGFCLLNLAGDFEVKNFDTNLWWVDLRILPASLAALLLWPASLLLIAFAARPPHSLWRRTLTATFAAVLGIASLWNAVEFYRILFRGQVHAAIPLPFSAVVLAGFFLISWCNWRRHSECQSIRFSPFLLAAFAGCAILFPIGQMYLFGKTDYRRPADIAVVLGARTYKDGHPSDALQDRVLTACELYHQGLVKKILISGGLGDGPITEAQAGRRLCLQAGIPAADILTDDAGVNTAATIRDTRALAARLGANRILVVSHFYHLPRVKLAFHRAGIEVYTVPAHERRLFWKMPYFVARETAAVWAYYFRSLAG